MSQKIIDFVIKYYPYAFQSEIDIKIPTVFTLAQAALETGWGAKSIGNNLFGITANNDWTGEKELIDTFEFHDKPDVKYPEIVSITPLPEGKFKYVVKRHFRKYTDVATCFNDHNEFLLKDRYKKAFEHTNDPKKFATAIADAGYATGMNYAKTLHGIIDRIAETLKNITVNYPQNACSEVTEKSITVRCNASLDAEVLYLFGLKLGTKVRLLQRKNDWSLIEFPIVGWVASNFLKPIENTSNQAIVNAPKLNIRNAPKGKLITKPLDLETKVKILEQNKGWTKVETNIAGWVFDKYLKICR